MKVGTSSRHNRQTASSYSRVRFPPIADLRPKPPLKPLLSALNCRTLIACQCRRRKLPPAQIELVPRSGVLEGGLRLALCSEKHGTQVSSKRERPVFNSLLRRAVFFR